LYIGYTPISKLPLNIFNSKNYFYRNELFIVGTKIDDIPPNLRVNTLYCCNTPLSKKYSAEDIKHLILSRGGQVDVVNTRSTFKND